MFRWFACAVLYVASLWVLFLRPDVVLHNTPRLWPVILNESSWQQAAYLNSPRAAFDLGWQAALYEGCIAGAGRAEGVGPNSSRSARHKKNGRHCHSFLEAASFAINATTTLTAEQLMNTRALLSELESHRSTLERVAGFFSFVNIVWVISIVGALATVGPCLTFAVGPTLLRIAVQVHEHIVVPMHKAGVFEVVAYVFAFLFAAQSCRYPQQHAAGSMVGLSAGLALAPCWAYSTALWADTKGGNQHAFASFSGSLMAMALTPLALIHGSGLIGFFAVGALYTSLGFCFGAFSLGFYIGFTDEAATHRCTLASFLIVCVFTMCRLLNVSSSLVRPFAGGAMVLGNTMYFLGLLILSSEWHSGKTYRATSYRVTNGTMLVSLVLAILVGSVFHIPAATNTSLVFLVLWAMSKELECEWGAARLAVLFANFVALYFAALYLHTHPSIVTALFDPEGVYYKHAE